MSDKGDEDGWKTILFFNPMLYLPASLGGFGEDAKKASDEYAAVIGHMFVVSIDIIIVGIVIWVVGHFFGFW